MDAYSLKKDNRKKFQDKQKLKKIHPTASDRKYKAINRQKQIEEENKIKEQAAEDGEEKEIPNNLDRYKENEFAIDNLEDNEVTFIVNEKLKKIIKDKSDDIESELRVQDDLKTTKDLGSMDISELNKMLKSSNIKSKEPSPISDSIDKSKDMNLNQVLPKDNQTPPKNYTKSNVPMNLNKDEDFLDGLI